jgi:F-type H+-transporting ATPase subunit c
MKRFFTRVGVVLAGVFASTFAFAQGGGDVSSQSGLIAIGAALAVGLATAGAATGQGKAASTVLEGIARNPGASDKVFMPFILGLVFMEFQALLGFVISILWTLK